MKVKCHRCSQKYSITEELFGNEMTCQNCGEAMTFYAKDVLPSNDLQASEQAHPQGKPKLITPAAPNQSLAGRPLVQHTAQKSSRQFAIILLLLALVIGGGFLFYQTSKKQDTETSHTEKETKTTPSVAIEPMEPKATPVAVVKNEPQPKKLSKKALRRKAAREKALLIAGNFEKDIVPILESTCMECHDEISEEGDLNLELYLQHQHAVKNPDLWEKIAKVVSMGQMPPSDRKRQLTPEEKETLQNWVVSLSAKWEAGEMGTDPGRTTIHRLNKYEYNYTVRDLFGLNIWTTENFPEDGSGESGFSNTADALFLPTLLAENYFEAAKKIVDTVYSNSQSRSRYLYIRPSANKPPNQAAKEVLSYWATFIYRKPANEQELARLLKTFQSEFDKKQNYSEAMQMPLFAMLVSPNFLYRSTITEAKPGVQPLNDFELASKLSYFLWSSMPDKELFSLAQKGELSKEEVLVAQAKRMLADDKAQSLGKHLGGQWFGWEELRGAVNPDGKKFPEFDMNLRIALYKESSMYFNHLVKTNGSIYDFLDSDYTFLNDRLARFYKLPPVSGGQFRLVKLDDKNRGGVLGMGSVLTSTSLALRSSPSIRGAYVLRDILGIPLPEPPMDVEPLPADDKSFGKITLRESLIEHRTNPDCRSCHSEIDPIGFGLEAFDAIGRFRTHQNGVKIDVSGIMPDGTQFSSPAELKATLIKNKDLFAKNAAKKFLTYALGRELSPYDRQVVKKISDEIISNNGSIQTGLIEVVKSYPFRNRRGENITRPKTKKK